MQLGAINVQAVRDLSQSVLPERIPTVGGAGSVGRSGGISAREISVFPNTQAVGKGGFSNLLDRAVSEIDGTLKTAEAEKTKVLTGESSNVHQAIIAMQEAGVAFSLMVEVRNKLVESYQELMRMQV